MCLSQHNRVPWRRNFLTLLLPSTSKLCDKQTWGYLLNQSWSRLKMKQVVVIVRISSSPDTLSSLLQADPARGRVRGKETADHQLKLSCQQIHHYSLTGTSKDWSRQPSCQPYSCHWAPYCQLRLTRLLHTGTRIRKAAWLEASPLWAGRWQVLFHPDMFPKYYLQSVQKYTKKEEPSWSLFNL